MQTVPSEDPLPSSYRPFLIRVCFNLSLVYGTGLGYAFPLSLSLSPPNLPHCSPRARGFSQSLYLRVF